MAQPSKASYNLIEKNIASPSSPGGRRPEGDEGEAAPSVPTPPTLPDPQVKAQRQPRRTYSNQYRLRILQEYESCQNSHSRGALLRREGLYHSRINVWRKLRDEGKLSTSATKAIYGKNAARVDGLTRENQQLKKKLAQAEAIIELQKKVSELLGTHILSTDNNEVN